MGPYTTYGTLAGHIAQVAGRAKVQLHLLIRRGRLLSLLLLAFFFDRAVAGSTFRHGDIVSTSVHGPPFEPEWVVSGILVSKDDPHSIRNSPSDIVSLPVASSGSGAEKPAGKLRGSQSSAGISRMLVDAVLVHTTQWPYLYELMSVWGDQTNLSSWDPANTCAKMVGLTCDASGKIIGMDLSYSGLQTPLPDALSGLTAIQEIRLGSNLLVGSLPVSWQSLSELTLLDLSNNYLDGEPTNVFPAMAKLKSLSLGSNGFTGNLPAGILSLSALSYLDLNKNSFSGSIPATVSRLSKLVSLSVSYNILSGIIPSELGQVTTLMSIDISSNLLFGSVPLSIMSLPRLQSMDVSNNQLSGKLPSTFASSGIRTGLYSVGQNYFTGLATVVAGGQRFCPSQQSVNYDVVQQDSILPNPALLLNCLAYTTTTSCTSGLQQETQRKNVTCAAFCGATVLPAGPCGGNGECFLDPSRSFTPTCLCSKGYLPDIGIKTVDGVSVSYPTCSVVPTNVPPTPKVPSGAFKTGLLPGDLSGKSFNKFFRYASFNIDVNAASPTWIIRAAIDWRSSGGRSFLGPVRDQGSCAGCWAITAVDSVSATYGATYNTSAPQLSAQEIIDCAVGDCAMGGYPGEAFRFIASPPVELGGKIATEQAYPFNAGTGACRTVPGTFSTSMMYEAVRFYGWLGIALAAMHGPVVVGVAGDSESFSKFSGGYVYNDPACFANGIVNHNVLVVGYNLIAPVPYWIIRNSWGTVWGDAGYMNMAVAAMEDPRGEVPVPSSAGVCGIYTSPALYPVIRNPAQPCNPNPCGVGRCNAAPGSTVNTCTCPAGYAAVTNVDGTQSCGPVAVCSLYQTNPCLAGTCVNDGKGSYSCVCPPGLKLGENVDGSALCLPDLAGVNQMTYTVTGYSTTCYNILLAFGLTAAKFTAQNRGVKCDYTTPLASGLVLSVANPGILPCSVPYTVSASDTCSSIIDLFGSELPDLQLLNPGLSCSKLFAGMQICVARGDAYELPICTTLHSVLDGETCSSIMAMQSPPLSPLDFFAMNPGVMCDNLMPTREGDGMGGQAVCVADSTYGVSCPYKTYTVRRNEACSNILSKYFQAAAKKVNKTPPALYIDLNKSACENKQGGVYMSVGFKVCLPKGVSA